MGRSGGSAVSGGVGRTGEGRPRASSRLCHSLLTSRGHCTSPPPSVPSLENQDGKVETWACLRTRLGLVVETRPALLRALGPVWTALPSHRLFNLILKDSLFPAPAWALLPLIRGVASKSFVQLSSGRSSHAFLGAAALSRFVCFLPEQGHRQAHLWDRAADPGLRDTRPPP